MTVGFGAEVNRMHESLIKMMIAIPPVTAVFLRQGLAEILFCSFAGEPGCSGVQRNNLAVAVD